MLLGKKHDGLDSFRRYNLVTKDDQFNTEEFETYFQLGALVDENGVFTWYPMQPSLLQISNKITLISFSFGPDFINKTIYNPLKYIQSAMIVVRKCLLPKNCKDESEIRKFLNDFGLEFTASASSPAFVNNQDFLNYKNKFV